MASGQFATVFRHLRQLLGNHPAAEQTDGQLLHRFVHEHEQTAFTMLVQRHGPMVLGLCRRTLQDEHAAEDVFQAAFLVLVRKARSLHQYGSLGNWLYTVTHHLALKTRARQARQRLQERQVNAMPEPVAGEDGGWSELRPLLDAELARLPAKYREPVVLCYLEGKTNEDAARELGWPVGTVKVRLSRARDLLRDRLTRRGLALSVTLLGPGLAASASVAVPSILLESTTESAALFAAGKALAAGAGSMQAVLLAQGALKAMFFSKLQAVAALLLMIGLLGAGTGALVSQSPLFCPEGAGQNKHPSTTVPQLPPLVIVAETPNVDAPKTDVPKAEASKDEPSKADLGKHIRTQLSRGTLTIEIPPNTPLGDALKEIGKAAKVPILIDTKAFEAIGVQKVEEQPVQLEKLTNVKLTTVLKKVLEQVRGDVYTGTFHVRSDHVEVTTTYNILAEAGASPPEHPALRDGSADPEGVIVARELWSDPTRRMCWSIVWVEADKQPLAEALREVSPDPSAIVIDPRIADKAKTPVSLSINRVLYDTAITLLVEQADLDWMQIDQLVYVSSKENIKARKQQIKAREEEYVRQLRETAALKRQALVAAPSAERQQLVQQNAQLPLDQAVQEIARTAGVKVVIDPRVADKAKALVKMELNGIPPETAIKLLADMADLRAVPVDNVLYLTSKENAKSLQEGTAKETKPLKP